MRIVLDTNILARAASGPPGPADDLLLRCVVPPYVLCLSPFILSELSRVLRYPRVQKIHGMADRSIDDYLRELQLVSLVVSVPPFAVDAVVPSDPKDDPIVATAVHAKAKILCTLDRHLHAEPVVVYCAERGVEVVTDLDLLHRLRSGAV